MIDEVFIPLLTKHFSPWKNMTVDQQKELLDNTILKKFTKGANLHGGDQDCLGIMLVKQGMLRTYLLSEEGKEITLYRLEAGDMCVLSSSCILSSITFDVHIDAETDGEALLISSAYFAKLTEENIYAECFVYKMAADRFSDVMWAMQQILFMSFDKRLAVFLWDELTKTNDDTIHYTHEQIAKYMGSAREVVSRMLKYFSTEGIVELSRGGIKIIDKHKLQQLT